LAKRLREFFEEVLPDNLHELLQQLHAYRDTLKGNFEEKVNKLKELTADFLKRDRKDQ
jgi:precorrin-2 dehydrogenase/sirohydrochlorin ferrochelatase